MNIDDGYHFAKMKLMLPHREDIAVRKKDRFPITIIQ